MTTRAATLRCAVGGLFLVLCACGGKKAVSGAQKEQLEQCATVLQDIPHAHPADRSNMLAEKCPFACPAAFADYPFTNPGDRGRLLAQNCGLYCKREGKTNYEQSFAQQLLSLCGPDYYGLESGQELLMSLDWFVIQRTGKWLAEQRSRLGTGDRELAERLGAAMAFARIPLPVPRQVEGEYDLPVSQQAEGIDSRVYVIASTDEPAIGALPWAVLTQQGARIEAGPGSPFPGKAVRLSDLKTAVVELDEAAKEPKPPKSTEEQVEEALAPAHESAPPSVLADRAPASEVAEREAPSEATARMKVLAEAKPGGVLRALQEQNPRPSSGDSMALGPRARREAPLVFADRALSAERALSVIAALGIRGARLAAVREEYGMVRGVGVHRVRLVAHGARPRILLFVDGGDLRIWAEGTEDVDLQKTESGFERSSIQSALRRFSRARSVPLTVAADKSATVADLVAVLDAVAGAGYQQVAVLASTDVWAVMGREAPQDP